MVIKLVLRNFPYNPQWQFDEILFHHQPIGKRYIQLNSMSQRMQRLLVPILADRFSQNSVYKPRINVKRLFHFSTNVRHTFPQKFQYRPWINLSPLSTFLENISSYTFINNCVIPVLTARQPVTIAELFIAQHIPHSFSNGFSSYFRP